MRPFTAALLLGFWLLTGCHAEPEPVAGPPLDLAGSQEPDFTAHHHSHPHPHDHAHPHTGDHAHADEDHSHLHPASDPSAPCTCDSADLSNIWCRKCNVGYIAGQSVEYPLLFETLDPHGHVIALEALQCTSCLVALEENGFCDACGMGFVARKTYFSKLTHGLALGHRAAASSDRQCIHSLPEPGWCKACNRGMVGNVIIADRATFDRTDAEFKTFLKAIDRAETCELCACAMVVHRTCPSCLISYELSNQP